MKEILKIILWGQGIGRLAWHDARKTSFFTYNPEFLNGSLDIAPLAASIRTTAIKNGVSDQWTGMVEATIAAHIQVRKYFEL